MIDRAPPVVGLAAGFGLGVALLPHVGPPHAAALILAILLLLIQLFTRPVRRAATPGRDGACGPAGPPSSRQPPRSSAAAQSTALVLALLAGLLAGSVGSTRSAFDCRWSIPDGFEGHVVGRFSARPGQGSAPFRVEEGLPRGCRATVPALIGRGSSMPAVGEAVRARARWRRSARPRKGRPDLAGTLVLDSARVGDVDARASPARLLRARGSLQATLHDLLPSTAPLAEALILARKEALPRERRERFARSGTAHLLAISGFHVGVLAALLLSLARGLGAGPRGATVTAAVGAWAYVAFIGAPDAASRAALILSLFALGRLLGRPVLPSGALATAFLILVLSDPTALSRPGLQLSFAGAAGLLYGRRPLAALLAGRWTGWLPAGVRSAVAAGVAATLATLPLVAWHFDRVSLVGIPATLTAAPLVALAIPGLLGLLMLAPLFPGAAGFLAGGVDLVLRALEWVVTAWAALPHASVWLPRVWVMGGGVGALAGLVWAATIAGLSRRTRLLVVLMGLGAGVLAAPVVDARSASGTLELDFLDVGQGDAIAVRSPRGRWILVDAGPRTTSRDAGRRVIVPFFRRRGVGVLEAMVLTHPDQDHIGGAGTVLRGLGVKTVLDPAVAVGKPEYARLLGIAAERSVPWLPAREGRRFTLDGVEISVLAPPSATARQGVVRGPPASELDANEQSVVLELRYGAFQALLTGDAPAEVERRVVMVRPPSVVQVLKVGHHGSETSTSWEALMALRPELAVISVGAHNRYGHPAREVTDRLARAGARVLRTDQAGTVTVRARPDGTFDVLTERAPARR